MPKLLIVLAVGLLLGACATQAQKRDAEMSQSMRQDGPVLDACIAKMKASPEYAALSGKIRLWGGMPTLAQQTDASLATAEDAALLRSYHQQYLMPCRQISIDMVNKLSASYAPILVDRYAKTDAVYASLVTQKATWGDANKALAAIEADASTRMTAAMAETKAALNASHQAELNRRAQAAQALGASMVTMSNNMAIQQQNQQMINAMNRPRTTNCQYVGAMLQCSTF